MGRSRASISPEARELELTAMAYDAAEKRMREGTATAQEIVYWLKAGSSRERAEREKLERENALLRAKTESLQSAKRVEALYSEAMTAFRSYAGLSPIDEEDDDYDD